MIEARISGQSCRQISKWSTPQVAHNTLARFFKTRLQPSLQNAAILLAVDPPEPVKMRHRPNVENRGITTEEWEQMDRVEQTAVVEPEKRKQVEQLATQAIVAAPSISIFRSRLEKLHGRIDRTLDKAEEAVRVVDVDGKMVSVGSDLSPMAPLFNAASKNLEMLGRATGELEPVGAGSVSIQIVCPSAGSPAGELPRVSFAAVDQIEAADEDEVYEIGLLQKP